MRLFIACPIDNEIRKNLDAVIRELKKSYADVKWVKPESIHITLKFLGDTEENKIDGISTFLSSCELGKGTLAAKVHGIGFFPDARRPRVIWAGLEESPRYLAELSSIIDRGIEKFGYEREKQPFSPHITLGRFRSAENLKTLINTSDKLKDSVFGTFNINCFSLYSSVLKPSGAEYKVLRSFKL